MPDKSECEYCGKKVHKINLQDHKEDCSKNPNIKGLGGWMIIPLINLYFVAILYVYIFITYIIIFEKEGVLILLFTSVITIYLTIRTILYMHAYDKEFPRWFISWLWITLALSLIESAILDDYSYSGGMIIFAIIWTNYMLKSKRVKNTFTKITNKKFECSNCKAIISESAEYCLNCGSNFIEKIEKDIKKITSNKKDKNKEWMNVLIFFAIIIFIWLIIPSSVNNTSFIEVENNNLEEEENFENSNFEKEIDNNAYSSIKELHWDHMPLTFYIKESCKTRLDGKLEKSVYRALDFISSRTDNVIRFQNKSTPEADIIFNCDKVGKGFTLAEALPQLDGNNIIISGEVFIYSADGCLEERPVTFIHEIIHLFGIGHYAKTDSEDIMREYHYGKEFGGNPCDNDLTERDISCLKYIYSDGEIEGNCSEVEFLDFEYNYEYSCEEGTYETIDGEYCCQEPNMIIDSEGYCSY